ncbi:hypothetical protein GCM10018953_22190 [Streptosporangium nondiastaticum]
MVFQYCVGSPVKFGAAAAAGCGTTVNEPAAVSSAAVAATARRRILPRVRPGPAGSSAEARRGSFMVVICSPQHVTVTVTARTRHLTYRWNRGKKGECRQKNTRRSCRSSRAELNPA